jgi:hypothetical protein
MSDKEYPEKHRPGKLGTEKFDWYPTIPMEWYSVLTKESREPEKKEKKIE